MADEVYKANTLTSTGTAVPAAGADNHIPTGGSVANWGSITSESFLSGPKPGQEQVLVKVGNQTAKVAEGQRLEEIQKKHWFHVYDTATEDGVFEFDQHRKTTVSLNDTLTVLKNQSVGVKLDQDVTVEQNQYVKVNEKRNVEAKFITEVGYEKIYIRAGTELVLEGPGGQMIKIDSKGVTIQGVIVRIN
ncbi:MAG TPA: hypothetical protein VIC84_01570 [Blastocatellia bacterium]|jgi:hypothetical protein